MSKFFQTDGFKCRDPKRFDSNKYSSNISIGSILQVDLEFPEELRELYFDQPLAPDEIKIGKEMSIYQLKIANSYCQC